MNPRNTFKTEFDAWLARHAKCSQANLTPAQITLLLAYAFYSQRLRGDQGIVPAGEVWTEASRLSRALRDTETWAFQVLIDLRHVPPCHSQSVSTSGFEFIRLARYDAIMAEDRDAQHALGKSLIDVAWGFSQLFSVRHAGERVATVELGATEIEGPLDRIRRVYVQPMSDLEPDIIGATCDWLCRVRGAPSLAKPRVDRIAVDDTKWVAYWTPFWSAHGGCKFIPHRPTSASIDVIIHEVHALDGLLRSSPSTLSLGYSTR